MYVRTYYCWYYACVLKYDIYYMCTRIIACVCLCTWEGSSYPSFSAYCRWYSQGPQPTAVSGSSGVCKAETKQVSPPPPPPSAAVYWLTVVCTHACVQFWWSIVFTVCICVCVCVCVCVCCVVCMSGAGSLVHLEKVYITFSCVVIPLYYPGSDNLIAMFCVHWLVQPQVWFIVVCLVCVQLM